MPAAASFVYFLLAAQIAAFAAVARGDSRVGRVVLGGGDGRDAEDPVLRWVSTRLFLVAGATVGLGVLELVGATSDAGTFRVAWALVVLGLLARVFYRLRDDLDDDLVERIEGR